MFHIYFKRPNNGKFRVGANILLMLVDKETTRYSNREEHLFNVGANRADALPLDLSEKAYILKETEDEDTEYGEVLYSDCADIFDIDNNKEKILNRFNTPECIATFLGKYLELSAGKDIKDKTIKEVRKILELLKEQNVSLFPFLYTYFETLMEEICKDYEYYRFAYLANKSIEKKKVKCITKNIIGKRKIQ